MAKRISYASIEAEIGFKPSKHPKDNYRESAEVVWCVMRNSVPDTAQPEYLGGRKGYHIGTGVVQAIRQVWDLPDKEVNSARGQIVKHLRAHGSTVLVSPGRGKHVQPEWWVADTFEEPQDATPAEETMPAPVETPTDWKDAPAAPPANNGKVVEVLPLTEQAVPGDSYADRLEKAFETVREVVADLEDENRRLRTERESLIRFRDNIGQAVQATISD